MTVTVHPRHLLNLGVVLTGLAGLAGEAAWLHMRALGGPWGAICGAVTPTHCALCPLSLVLLLAGLASLAGARWRARASARVSG